MEIHEKNLQDLLHRPRWQDARWQGSRLGLLRQLWQQRIKSEWQVLPREESQGDQNRIEILETSLQKKSYFPKDQEAWDLLRLEDFEKEYGKVFVEELFLRAEESAESFWHKTLVERDILVIDVRKNLEKKLSLFWDVQQRGHSMLWVLLHQDVDLSLELHICSQEIGSVHCGFFLQQGSHLRLIHQLENKNAALVLGTSLLSLMAYSRCELFSQTSGTALVDHTFEVFLKEPEAYADLRGFYSLKEQERKNISIHQEHQAPQTQSYSTFYGIAQDESYQSFKGLIRMNEGAFGSQAYLTNRHLLLSQDARSDSVPMLEISCNDVSCSHGSSTSSLDSMALFYLQSRGFSLDEASQLLEESFFAPLLAWKTAVLDSL